MNSNKKNKAVIFARSNSGVAAVNQQVRALTKYADKHGINVVATLRMPHCSATDFEVRSHLAALIGVRRGQKRANMIIVTDVSRLARRGVPHAMNLIKKLADAGVAVVTPDLGVVNESLWRSFPLLMKGWAKWKKKSVVVPTDRKELAPDASKNDAVARDDEDADPRGDGPVHGRAPRPHRRDGSPKSDPEVRP